MQSATNIQSLTLESHNQFSSTCEISWFDVNIEKYDSDSFRILSCLFIELSNRIPLNLLLTYFSSFFKKEILLK